MKMLPAVSIKTVSDSSVRVQQHGLAVRGIIAVTINLWPIFLIGLFSWIDSAFFFARFRRG
ncbi:uncharacterized protein BDZ83DRAFT_616159 [Colletotrichum acutatum]|uniref:Uncharacterized protein n=1 Tax=Glomerella acutata TaxID=27357 RepID=A0AAD8UMH1_GLOAC|nr:uncharacterized protein BDZ83DRAFT_616159 [Colletotrichum acutatum]KAK1726531.1 hypothetical protein BDZ83DRAFT_616159 [Colletotrichum acutatum]